MTLTPTIRNTIGERTIFACDLAAGQTVIVDGDPATIQQVDYHVASRSQQRFIATFLVGTISNNVVQAVYEPQDRVVVSPLSTVGGLR